MTSMAKPSARRGDVTPRALSRCAIYTRKSTEDGLEQEFNSLDAQREACAAYIVSQKHEGWTPVSDHYDDGGFSGGSMDRPGLKQLLADVQAGKVNVIVVYKVDRLTRSLADFAKIVDVLDAADASFVSVTQSFNTTTSMGRLTLNVLLSFAQFEREVTGERIRDKVAASKAKGMWMGGPVPLGYDIRDRKLVINEIEAESVRRIFRRYLEVGSLHDLVAILEADGITTKHRQMSSGREFGGTPFRRGGLAHLLNNPVYVGEVRHRQAVFPGEHDAIIDRKLWDAVQARLRDNIVGTRPSQRAQHCSLLAGRIFDGEGRRMSPSHANKGTQRYRYYVTLRDGITSGGAPTWRVPAHDLEHIVVETVARWLESSDHQMADARDEQSSAAIVAKRDRGHIRAGTLRSGTSLNRHAMFTSLVERIDVRESEIAITMSEVAQSAEAADAHRPPVVLTAPATRIRRGNEVRLVIGEQDGIANRDERLVALMAESHAARDFLFASPIQQYAVAAVQFGRSRKHFARLVQLAYLAPDIVVAILNGRQPVKLSRYQMLTADRIPLRWDEQRAMFGFAPAS